jgi:hypothetical protein
VRTILVTFIDPSPLSTNIVVRRLQIDAARPAYGRLCIMGLRRVPGAMVTCMATLDRRVPT